MPDGQSMRESTLAKYEDAIFMLEMGETKERAAVRLGMTVQSLDRLMLRARRMVPEREQQSA